MQLTNPKLMTLPQAAAWRDSLRAQNKKLMMTNGCFDILHAGHLYYLEQARRGADALIVAINTDASVKMNKGPLRPINDEQVRAYQLAACWFVDAVVIFGNKRVNGEIEALAPDVYCKSQEYTLETLPQEETAALRKVGAQIIFMPFLQGFSTTGLVKRIHAAAGV